MVVELTDVSNMYYLQQRLWPSDDDVDYGDVATMYHWPVIAELADGIDAVVLRVGPGLQSGSTVLALLHLVRAASSVGGAYAMGTEADGTTCLTSSDAALVASPTPLVTRSAGYTRAPAASHVGSGGSSARPAAALPTSAKGERSTSPGALPSPSSTVATPLVSSPKPA